MAYKTKPRFLDEVEASLLNDKIKLHDLNNLYVFEYRGDTRLSILIGSDVVHAIGQMVVLATATKGQVPFVEAEANGCVVRAFAGDDPKKLGNEWWWGSGGGGLVTTKPRQEPELESGSEPKNNDGRENCFWCGAPTKTIELAFSTGNICTQCER